jgi:MoxR-like ATPase
VTVTVSGDDETVQDGWASRIARAVEMLQREREQDSVTRTAAARATAYVLGRDYCVPDDIVSNALPVCAHRVISRTYMHQGDTLTTRRIMQRVLESVPSPV